MLTIKNLSQGYGKTPVLMNINITTKPGEIVALLGANGAGKTTLISTAAGLMPPQQGRITLDGYPLYREKSRSRFQRLQKCLSFPGSYKQHTQTPSLIGVAPQELGLYPTRRVRETLVFFAALYQAKRVRVNAQVDTVIEEMMLDRLQEKHVSELSGGQKRRLHTAIALVHQPNLLFLDEPTVGADIQTRKAILATVRKRACAGATVIYSSHYLPEIEDLADRIIILSNGRVAVDKPRNQFENNLEQIYLETTTPAQRTSEVIEGNENA